MHSKFRIVAIPTKVADLVRTNMRSPGYGHPAHKEVAAGYGPCRHCLRDFQVGKENRILFTYDPFHELEAPLPGPIFIHEKPCDRYDEGIGFPDDIRSHALTLVAYGENRRHLAEEHVADGTVEAVIEQLFTNQSVKYLHVRDTEAGCYDFRVERG